MAGAIFGVSVEEALTRSGMLNSIIHHFEKMSQDDWHEIKAKAAILDSTLQEMSVLKDRFNAKNRTLKNYTKKSRGKAKDATQSEGMRKAKNAFNEARKALQIKLISVFKMEHELLDTLTEGQTSTADYAIYYYGEAAGSGKVIYSSRIAAEDLYQSDFLNLDSRGNLVLSRQVTQAKELFKKDYEKTLNEDPQALQDLDELVKTMMFFFKELRTEYDKIKAEASKKHLGSEKDQIHDLLLKMQDSEEIKETFLDRVNQMRSFLLAGGSVGPGGRINRGHIMEAYAHLQDSREKGSAISYYQAMKRALNDDPWYIGGDVAHTQVKTFFDNNDRQIATYGSIISLGHQLVKIITSASKAIFDSIRQKGLSRIKAKESVGWRQSDKALQELLEKEVEQLMKILDN